MLYPEGWGLAVPVDLATDGCAVTTALPSQFQLEAGTADYAIQNRRVRRCVLEAVGKQFSAPFGYSQFR